METHERATPSLRARKKARQRLELLKAAAELFRKQGYQETRMEDIAAQAEVSTKTVYNYFSTKQQVLIELLTNDRQSLIENYAAVVANPPDDLAEALALLIRADVGDVRSPEDKKLWRELIAAETCAHEQADDDFEMNRRIFLQYIERLLTNFQKKGELLSSISVSVAAEMVYAINAYDFRRYCAAAEASPDDVLKIARRQMRHMISSWQSTPDSFLKRAPGPILRCPRR